MAPDYHLNDPDTDLYVGDCRDLLDGLPDVKADLIFADPPFGVGVDYGECKDELRGDDYYLFTYCWLRACVARLAPRGSIWVNIPDEWQAEVCVILKAAGLKLINHVIWHYRFGQHRTTNFIVSKTHALYFARDRKDRTWNGRAVLEPSDRASVYDDPRTRETATPGLRVPLDVWYGPLWGRVQGNNKERRPAHQNQLPEVYLERVIRACSNPGDLVLDCFSGSGTTLTVARALGRRSVGVELDPALAKSSWERISSGAVRVK